jgi:hypothetical protein
MPREEGFAKQTQVMPLGRWCAEDVAWSDFEIGVKMEPWLRRYSGKRCLKNMVEFPTDLMPGGGCQFTKKISRMLY